MKPEQAERRRARGIAARRGGKRAHVAIDRDLVARWNIGQHGRGSVGTIGDDEFGAKPKITSWVNDVLVADRLATLDHPHYAPMVAVS